MSSELKIWNATCNQWETIFLGDSPGGGGCISVTYTELVALILADGLTCGQKYVITDYQTVHYMVDGDGTYILDGEEPIIVTGETEPLIVLATSTNTLAREAYSPAYPQDIIKYDWDNSNYVSFPEFYAEGEGAVTGWKGVITRREDTLLGNKVNFDYRVFTYRLWNIEQTAWDKLTEYYAGDFVQGIGANAKKIYYGLDTSTDIEPGTDEGWEDYWKLLLDLDDGDGGMNNYVSLSPSGFYCVVIDENISIVAKEDYVDKTMFPDDSCIGNQFDECLVIPYTTFGSYCEGNTFGTGCEANTFGTGCQGNTFGTGCEANTFGSYCGYNTFGTGCQVNTFDTGCYSNTFGTGCQVNTFGISCNGNTFGTGCNGNTFGTGCNGNTFGKYCEANTFGSGCEGNTFGTGCEVNTFGSGCEGNTFGTGCEVNTFGSGCNGNTFGSGCNGNTFGTGCNGNTFGIGCNGNTFGTGCYFNTFGTGCYFNTFPTLARYNEFKDGVSSLDCSAFTAVYDTNVTHQIGTSGTIYQTYIDESGTPTMVISTGKIGIYSA